MSKKPNLSRPIVFGYGTVVKHAVHGTGVVDHEFDADMACVLFYKNKLVNVKLNELRKISLKEYHFFRLPSGEWVIGRHNAIWMGMLYLAFLCMFIYGIVQAFKEGAGWLALSLFAMGVTYLMLKGLRLNYESSQM